MLYVRLINPITPSIRSFPIALSRLLFIVFAIKPNTCSILTRLFDFIRFAFFCVVVNERFRYPFSWILLFMFCRSSNFSIPSLRYAESA